jgi:AraC-like DNA-binding protein
MAAMIPLIRAGALMPFVRWMQANGRPVEEWLREVDLAYLPRDDPDQPIPLGPAFAFVRAASRHEGPDFACRIVSRSSVAELGVIGRVALGSGSVREALTRVQAALRCHVTHALLTAAPAPGGLLLREAWIMRLDQATRHIVQQYAAALFQALCQHSGAPLPLFGRVALAPHPVHGVAHLRPWFGDAVEPSPDGALELFIPAHVADRPLCCGRPGGPAPVAEAAMVPLCGAGGLAASARVVVGAMLAEGVPTVGRLAAAAGTSVRTLQRRLAAEGTTFAQLLEAVRRDRALEGLAEGDRTASAIATGLGYGQQSSLTRAVRRWTGTPPRSIARARRA